MNVDTLIRNALIVDGTGRRKPYCGDVAISQGRIAAVGMSGTFEAGEVIDATGQAVCPGFIDVHVHSEFSLLAGRDRFAGVLQGVTTQLSGPDGFGWAGLPEREALEYWRYTSFISCDATIAPPWPEVQDYLAVFKDRLPSNLHLQAPHHAIRLGAMGWAGRSATEKECDAMLDATRAWLDVGAGALSTGLDYQPGACADFKELSVLGGLVREYGRVFAMHIRTQELGRRGAWEEVVALAREGVPIHVSHERVDKDSEAALEIIDRESLDVTFDTYLYSAGMTHLSLMLPIEYQKGTPQEVVDRLCTRESRVELTAYFRTLFQNNDPIVAYTGSGRFIGMTLKEAAASEGKAFEELAYDILVEEEERQAFIFPWSGSESEIETILCDTITHPRMMVASDGIYNIAHPHPRSFGCFPRILDEFVRKRNSITLEEAVYKMSNFPAQRFGVPDRGELKPGMIADLVLFDPDAIGSPATFEKPIQAPTGISRVMVNGEWVVEAGKEIEVLPGQVLYADKT